MNDSDGLPPDHFWDSEQAQKKYDGAGRGIVEAEAKLEQAHRRLLTVQAVYDQFANTPGAVSFRERVEGIEDRLQERIVEAAREVVICEEEIMLLNRRMEALRILHYKPLAFKEFWSAMQITQNDRILINTKQERNV